QDKLDQTEGYCGLSCLFVNVPKTLASIHGPLPDPLPVLRLYRKRLTYVDISVYVGMSFCSTARDIFLPHYIAKELAARRVGNACFALESYTGPLPPLMAIRLYLSHLDPHLTGGCEIALDVRPSALDELEMIQHIFLRRALHVSKRSQIAPLHSETGIWPLRFRRLELALRFLRYLLTGQPALAYAALRESWTLANSDRPTPTWWSDLTIAARMLPVPLVIALNQWPTVEAVDGYIARIPGLVAEHLYTTILQSLRLPVIHRRVQYDCPTRPLIAKLCCKREYLQLPHHRERSAITLLLMSEHPLSIEQLRRGPTRIARELRICRWCTQPWAIEDETHVLLEC
ncbi:uncharacterized protein TRAVEDRAFT_79418, partial [Trametes versicolor FP-101664 SS1]|uniref:uncharacterized protein n=1 Tax=Trametes versicolor (strain FP-101664) TaxID=717944 RepID=UPI00046212A8